MDDVRVDIGEVVDTVGKVESCLVLFFTLLQFASDIIGSKINLDFSAGVLPSTTTAMSALSNCGSCDWWYWVYSSSQSSSSGLELLEASRTPLV